MGTLKNAPFPLVRCFHNIITFCSFFAPFFIWISHFIHDTYLLIDNTQHCLKCNDITITNVNTSYLQKSQNTLNKPSIK